MNKKSIFNTIQSKSSIITFLFTFSELPSRGLFLYYIETLSSITTTSIITLGINIECFILSVIMQRLAFFIVILNVVASLIKLDHLIKQ
jgi:hypothetical protein